MSRSKNLNHRAVLKNPGPRTFPQIAARQLVSVRVGSQSVQRPERIYQPGETFRCTLADADALRGEVQIID